MRVMALDYGEARIGIAVSDPTGLIASPHSVLADKDKGRQVRHVVDLARSLEVERLLVGIPYAQDGSSGPMADTAEKYARKLEEVSGLPVVRWDERYSSFEAEEVLKETGRGGRKKNAPLKGRVDMIAACLMLQAYLDSGAAR